ncbi:MAG: tripartite tricarboxylate transporter substrate binding protein [Burkholderiales bacterium]|nr:tripartite tricarboxylate transporter substrate binding protein [Burkholderiales bacterium]
MGKAGVDAVATMGHRAGGALVALMACISSVAAQPAPYPQKPVRLVVPFAPGGGTDIVARVLAQMVGESLHASVVVDNRGGAGGLIGNEMGVRANPDGYTLTFGASSYTTSAALHKLPYHPLHDITPIGLTAFSAYLLAVHPSVPVSSTAELVAYAKRQGKSLSYGTSGVGGQAHLSMEYFLMVTGATMNHVPYKGGGPALIDLVAGNIQFMMTGIGPAMPQVRAKRIRAFAVTSPKRWPELADVPTVAESIPQFDAGTLWYGVWGPKGLPSRIVARWNSVIAEVLQSQGARAALARAGAMPLTSTPAEFQTILRDDLTRWTEVVRKARIKSDATE